MFESLFRSAAMLWQMLWALVLGFSISAFPQTFVSKAQMARAFGRNGLREVSMAAALGAASSSCSYAAAATSRTVFRKGAAMVPTLTFLLASTNLVIEIGIVIWMLLGWRFVLAEVVGALIMIVLMWVLVHWFISNDTIEAARRHSARIDDDQHHHPSEMPGQGLLGRLKKRENWTGVPNAFVMDISMLWKEIVGGVLIAGFMATVIPKEWWEALFISGQGGGFKLIQNAILGPLIAVASFVCSVGNIPFAGLLWISGISFAGVIAFIYGDLIVLPLILAYRRYYGGRMAFSMTSILFVAMVCAAILTELLFDLCGLLPEHLRLQPAIVEAGFGWNYTAWLNLVALLLLGLFNWLRLRHTRHSGHANAQRNCHPGG